MATLGELRREVALVLPSTTTVAPFDIDQWINDAAKDIARRTEILEDQAQLAWGAGVTEMAAPTDLIRAHRCEFVDQSGNDSYLVQLVAKQELDQVWGILHTQESSYPSYGFLFGFPPNTTLQLFPVPAAPGTVNLDYYRLPAVMVADGDTCDLVAGWEDLIVMFVESRIQRKERDPLWSATKQLYDGKVADLVEKTRNWHDQAQMMTVGQRQVPSWLYDFDI